MFYFSFGFSYNLRESVSCSVLDSLCSGGVSGPVTGASLRDLPGQRPTPAQSSSAGSSWSLHVVAAIIYIQTEDASSLLASLSLSPKAKQEVKGKTLSPWD